MRKNRTTRTWSHTKYDRQRSNCYLISVHMPFRLELHIITLNDIMLSPKSIKIQPTFKHKYCFYFIVDQILLFFFPFCILQSLLNISLSLLSIYHLHLDLWIMSFFLCKSTQWEYK